MKTKIKKMNEQMAAYDCTAEGITTELLLDFADIVIWQLEKQNLKQKDLADRVGMKESQVTRIIQAAGNPTFGTVGKIMEALGIEINIVPKHGKPFEDKSTGDHHGQKDSEKIYQNFNIQSHPSYGKSERADARTTYS